MCNDMSKEKLWLNPDYEPLDGMFELDGKKFVHIKAAQNRLMRFMPYIEKVFPETAQRKGIIESNILDITDTKKALEKCGITFEGRLLLKDDAHLPIAGSVKARGGIHEVLKHAEELAMREGMLKPTDNYSKLASEEFKNFYSKYTIQVGSTGNLGLSIGIMGSMLGFNVVVHMSEDAKEWKKELLKAKGVKVVEYAGDYSKAVEEGRKLSLEDSSSYFVDDENSDDLFMGYATAALRLKVQLHNGGITVDEKHPLFVYIPCGVGGAPGGITFGLKEMFGKAVHCFFAEPIEASSLMLGMMEGKRTTVYDKNLSCKTIADGLACAAASENVIRRMKPLLSGVATVSDENLLGYQRALYEADDIYVEPSGAAGFGALKLLHESNTYFENNNISEFMKESTHIIWATGGGLVPKEAWEIIK